MNSETCEWKRARCLCEAGVYRKTGVVGEAWLQSLRGKMSTCSVPKLSHACMDVWVYVRDMLLQFCPVFLSPPKKSAVKHAYPHLLLALIGSQSLFFNNQPKLGISHNLNPFHPKQKTPKDSGNPRTIPAQCSLPDLNHDHPRPVFPAGPQPRIPTPSVPCRTSTATSRSQWTLPDLNGKNVRKDVR